MFRKDNTNHNQVVLLSLPKFFNKGDFHPPVLLYGGILFIKDTSNKETRK